MEVKLSDVKTITFHRSGPIDPNLDVWTIDHNLGAIPYVIVLDKHQNVLNAAGGKWSLQHTSVNQVVLRNFPTAVKCVCQA